MEYRYTLEPYQGPRSKHDCPDCDHKKTFTKYIDTITGEYLNDSVGRCDREVNCNYHYKPAEYFRDNDLGKPRAIVNRPVKPKKEISYVSYDIVRQSLNDYEENNFIEFLVNVFDPLEVERVAQMYLIGTAKLIPNSTAFWQCDDKLRVRTAKIMLFDKETGKRVKDENVKSFAWVHNYLNEFCMEQCFFGEHLLTQYPDKPVGIVESEKTAVISSIALPKFIWLATGSKTNNLKPEKCKALKNRKVFMFPDLGAYDHWSKKAKELGFQISDLLEKNATEEQRKDGWDLADYLIKQKMDYINNTEPLVYA